MEVHIPDLFDLQKIICSGQPFWITRLPEDIYPFITRD